LRRCGRRCLRRRKVLRQINSDPFAFPILRGAGLVTNGGSHTAEVMTTIVLESPEETVRVTNAVFAAGVEPLWSPGGLKHKFRITIRISASYRGQHASYGLGSCEPDLGNLFVRWTTLLRNTVPQLDSFVMIEAAKMFRNETDLFNGFGRTTEREQDTGR